MSLSVVAKFIDLQEAHIAAGALRAAGFQAEVFDVQFGTVDWIAQNALGGFRLSVPEIEHAEARALLADIRCRASDPEPSAPKATLPEPGALRRLAAFATMFVVGVSGSWLLLRRRWYSTSEWLGILLTPVLIVVVVAVVLVGGQALFNLIENPV